MPSHPRWSQGSRSKLIDAWFSLGSPIAIVLVLLLVLAMLPLYILGIAAVSAINWLGKR